ncbi:MAG: S8/S53 family peptidase, partial [Clostridia bacterium]|nr:S8/S53 family peptidase [Clostridia bacterium]
MKKYIAFFISILILSLISFSATISGLAAEEVSTYEKNVKLLYSHIGDMDKVWQTTKGKTDKKRARVVVIDSGIDYYLPAFLSQDGNTRISPLSYNADMEKTAEECGYDILLDDSSKLKHGTQVSGVIFADEENGVKGLAPECELIFIKTPLSESGGYTIERVKKALEYALTLSPDVVNLSLGWTRSDDPFEEEMKKFREIGTVVVSTAGNNSTSSPRHPAANENVIGVGAFSSLEYAGASGYGLALSSGYGDKNLSICAPGEFYTIEGLERGTSLAAPVVTSAIALYKSVYPDASYDKVLSDLFSSADDCGERGRDYRYGYGAVNISDFIFGKKIKA